MPAGESCPRWSGPLHGLSLYMTSTMPLYLGDAVCKQKSKSCPAQPADLGKLGPSFQKLQREHKRTLPHLPLPCNPKDS